MSKSVKEPMSEATAFPFAPEEHEAELSAIVREVVAAESLDRAGLEAIVRRHPKQGRGFFSKSEIIRGFRYLRARAGSGAEAAVVEDEESFLDKLRQKPVRTASGVAPLTVLTRPFPCPGRCIFCPSDVRMPKSYLSDEPGAQRAAEHRFDPYRQTLSRLRSFHHTGHRVDKIELIILGGTWSFYSEPYQLWFIRRCFEALNDFGERGLEAPLPTMADRVDFDTVDERVDPAQPGSVYNRVVERFLRRQPEAAAQEERERGSWEELAAVQRRNEGSRVRCVGLVVETRPDSVTPEEVVRMRRLGATKVQLGYQSLSDRVLEMNRRGHDVATSRRATALLRQAGFKLHVHWMPNLYGSSPDADVADFARLFSDSDFRPDELKLYPCSLIESAELMNRYRDGSWRPYTHDELLEVLVACLAATPEYCRLTRVIRDIPGTDIVDGNRLTNFRQIAEAELARRGGVCRDIRRREIRSREVCVEDLELRVLEYEAAGGRELFLQQVTADDRLAGFLRLRLPRQRSFVRELETSALLREVHVYGRVAALGRRSAGRAQHLGLGRELIERAAEIAAGAGYSDLAVISSVGTRRYYRRLGFVDGELYQHRPLARSRAAAGAGPGPRSTYGG